MSFDDLFSDYAVYDKTFEENDNVTYDETFEETDRVTNDDTFEDYTNFDNTLRKSLIECGSAIISDRY